MMVFIGRMKRKRAIPNATKFGRIASRGIPFGAKFDHVMLPKL